MIESVESALVDLPQRRLLLSLHLPMFGVLTFRQLFSEDQLLQLSSYLVTRTEQQFGGA